MSRLRARTIPVPALSAAQRDRMFAVFEAHYDAVDRARFEADLGEKSHVFLLESDGALRGFSTVVVDRLPSGDRDVVSIFSGDTVLDPAYRGQQALQWAFFRYIVRTKVRNPDKLVVWFLISKGYKTYLLLARNFPTYFPRRDVPTPPWARDLIVALAQRRFAEALDPQRLVLSFGGDHERLKVGVAPVAGEADPDIRFFVERNPGHADGDELCCIGVVDRHLMASWPIKRFRRGLRRAG